MGSSPLKGKRGPLSDGPHEATKKRTVRARGQHDRFVCLVVEILFYLRFFLAVYLLKNLKLMQPVYSSREGFFSLQSSEFPSSPSPEVSHGPAINNIRTQGQDPGY